MDDDRQSHPRYRGHLVLLLVVILLYVGGRASFLGQLFDFDMAGDAVSAEAVTREEVSTVAASGEREPLRPAANLEGVPVLVNNSLAPAPNPFTFVGQRPELSFITYTVQPNDTPIGIAEQFGIKSETLLGGNPFLSEESSALQTGTVLTILPIDGVLHDVQEGDTLEHLVQLYGVSADEIIAYEPNKLEFPYRLYPGTQVLVPGAVREVFVWTAPSLPSRPSSSDSTGSGIAPLVQGTGTFIWPVSYRRITQYYWYGHQAVDIGLPAGSAVVASDTGTVTWAGWNVYGYGNLIVINHGNGYETYYAHLAEGGIYVVPGQIVYQGNVIGASGNTGRSSGPHLHFEIRYFNTLLDPLGTLR